MKIFIKMSKIHKVSREERKKNKVRVYRSKKRFNPKKRKSEIGSSASAKKIRVSNCGLKPTKDPDMHYRCIDFLLVFTAISSLVKCKECDGKITFESTRKEGLGFEIQVKCEQCKNINYVPSSEKIDKKYKINLRFVFIMRVLGLGLAGCNKFCGLMDLGSSFLSKTVYSTYVSTIHTFVASTAQKFFSAAAKEEVAKMQKNTSENSTDCTVSGDGTWQKRGFSSLFGVASLIGYYSGKVLDIFVRSGYCQSCKNQEHKLNTEEFQEWHKLHTEKEECEANHSGAAGNMEVSAVIAMFLRSIAKYGIRFKNYIGDGDSKTYSGLNNEKPYGKDFTINKKECVGHVQKRMGKRLRDLVKNTTEEKEIKTGKNAGKKTKSKTLSGKGKLTSKMIDKLTIFYGLAIRRNCDSVYNMKKAIWATFFHYSSTDKNPQHDNCPTGADSWCKYQKAKATSGLEKFKHEPLPEDVLAAIKPIYEDLSKDELLQRCVGGFTQNNNESLNQLIWKIAPKSLMGSSKIVEIAAYIAACTFNEGSSALLAFLKDMGIETGPSACEYAKIQDEDRVSKADKEAEINSKEVRIRRRQEQKEAFDIAEAAGTLLYGAGIDDSV